MMPTFKEMWEEEQQGYTFSDRFWKKLIEIEERIVLLERKDTDDD